MTEHRTTPSDTDQMPGGIPYIIGNEAAERFSYYGMRTILTVFMYKYLHLMSATVMPAMSEAEAQEHYHTFASWVYFFPIFGAIISDAFTGKYRIILWVSVLYCIGHLSLALMGGPGLSPTYWLWLGLFLIALGSGGIKPCVSAHVGDQFGPRNQHLMAKVYQWFYFSINFGSTFSTILTPWLLEWYGPHIAFGIPGVLMAIATVMFWMGRNVFIHVPPAGATFLKEVFSWEGIKTIARLGIVYASISVFWALFDQTGSAWVLQAEDMNRNWLWINWLPSQIQVLNPILVMLLIPLFQYVVYPAIDPIFKLTPLRKISIGLFLTVLGFGLSGLVQQWIDHGGRPSIAWQFAAYVIITAAEVMVSITGLEFSYSQAPKSMKSVIMAVWLFSVSLGNIVTAVVNHAIQVPSINEVVSSAESLGETGDAGRTLGDHWLVRGRDLQPESSWKTLDEKTPVREIVVAGHDGKFGTADDVSLQFNRFMNQLSLTTEQDAALQAAKQKIDEAFFASTEDDATRSIPDDAAGQQLIAGMQDTYGQPLRYHRITRDRFRIVADGPDGNYQTPDDVVLNAEVSRASKEDGEDTKPYTWLERRLIELKGDDGRKEVEAGRGQSPTTTIGASITVGGLTTLEGAAYYWFWTNTMLGAAILFVPIAYFYRGKEHMQDSDEPAAELQDTETVAEATGE
ncbi:MAG: POT family MFS transporter [Planctomycetaceae bacterium]|nr:POT family MFS transporter [Planctomycetaceae bacterium]